MASSQNSTQKYLLAPNKKGPHFKGLAESKKKDSYVAHKRNIFKALNRFYKKKQQSRCYKALQKKISEKEMRRIDQEMAKCHYPADWPVKQPKKGTKPRKFKTPR